MNTTRQGKWVVCATGATGLLAVLSTVFTILASHDAQAGPLHGRGKREVQCTEEVGPATDDIGGAWYWLRSPDEEKRVVAGLFNRYCIRCHGVDGRGVWDIPGVPDFTSVKWQESRSDAQRARIILEGRGAVMPPFRGALSLEEAWALGRYLHTFVPGTEASRPDLTEPKPAKEPAPKKSVSNKPVYSGK